MANDRGSLTTVVNALTSPMESRYLRLDFQSDTSGSLDGTLAVNVEFDGCAVSGDIAIEGRPQLICTSMYMYLTDII